MGGREEVAGFNGELGECAGGGGQERDGVEVPQAARGSTDARQQRVTAQLTIALYVDSGTTHHAAATIHSLICVQLEEENYGDPASIHLNDMVPTGT
jgi:hypothetical protein